MRPYKDRNNSCPVNNLFMSHISAMTKQEYRMSLIFLKEIAPRFGIKYEHKSISISFYID